MSSGIISDVAIFVLALLAGVEVIGKVPATLHTPLMSAANSMHGIVFAGAMLIAVTAHSVAGYVLAFVAAFFAAANVVGGYAVTGRMLKMFRRRTPVPAAAAATGAADAAAGHDAGPGGPAAGDGAGGERAGASDSRSGTPPTGVLRQMWDRAGRRGRGGAS